MNIASITDLAVERPWRQTAGIFRDAPFTDELDAVIAEYQREDAEGSSEAPQDHVV